MKYAIYKRWTGRRVTPFHEDFDSLVECGKSLGCVLWDSGGKAYLKPGYELKAEKAEQ